MNLLSPFSPVETMLIIGQSSTLRNMLQFTCTDLLMRQVIATEKGMTPSLSNWAAELELPHSSLSKRYFVRPFLAKDPNMTLLLKTYVKLIINDVKSTHSFKNKVLSGPQLKPYITQNFFQRTFGLFTSPQFNTQRRTIKTGFTAIIKTFR